MGNYSPQLELAPRDEVSRAITAEMARTNHPCVYLDLTHVETDHVMKRFPNIAKVCAGFGLDIASDHIPVRPGAHYMIGGLTVDDGGATTVPSLWAAGESTSTGLHGANRLASNSLLEGLVYGKRTGVAASAHAMSIPDRFAMPPLSAFPTEAVGSDDASLDLDDIRRSLTSLMWRNVGIRRDAAGLADAARQVRFWEKYVATREFNSPPGWELQNMLLASRLIIAAAETRAESRGVHHRDDFPEATEPPPGHVSICARNSKSPSRQAKGLNT